MEDIKETDTLLRLHLKFHGIPEVHESPWILSPSPHGGRGIFATRDLAPGDLVFVDPPLVIGPRSGAQCPPLCVGCYKSGGHLAACTRGCGLPVCGPHCETRGVHIEECGRLSRWRDNKDGRGESWCPMLLRAVTPIRCLGLDETQRRLVRRLQTHAGPQHEHEVELLMKRVPVCPSSEDEEFMRVCCRALDANAFEVEVSPTPASCSRDLPLIPSSSSSPSSLPHGVVAALPTSQTHPEIPLRGTLDETKNIPKASAKEMTLPAINGITNGITNGSTNGSTNGVTLYPSHSNGLIEPLATKSSVRGLYPLSAMMNHACTPNTRHGYDAARRMVVRATTLIPRGAEVTTSYTGLLWGTPVRRHHLAVTKHFLCACARCRDPQESGSCLCALKCADGSCQGLLLPLDPITVGTKWVCNHCGLRMSDKQARFIQASLGQIVGKIAAGGPAQMALFLRGHDELLPTSNQLVFEMKSCLVWALGHNQGYQYKDLSEEDLEMKTLFCRELLSLLTTLGAGQCRMRGLLLYELHCSLVESQRRSSAPSKAIEEEALKVLEEVRVMFVDDITSPMVC